MRFRTAGTTEYILTDVQSVEMLPGYFAGKLARISDHAIGDVTGVGFDNTPEFYDVLFPAMPEEGKRFSYMHPLWQGCLSSTVSEILENHDNQPNPEPRP